MKHSQNRVHSTMQAEERCSKDPKPPTFLVLDPLSLACPEFDQYGSIMAPPTLKLEPSKVPQAGTHQGPNKNTTQHEACDQSGFPSSQLEGFASKASRRYVELRALSRPPNIQKLCQPQWPSTEVEIPKSFKASSDESYPAWRLKMDTREPSAPATCGKCKKRVAGIQKGWGTGN